MYRLTLICVVLALFLSSTGQSQESVFFWGRELGVGSRAMGMGGAFTGVADDYTATYWNPAGLGQIRRMEFNLGFSHNSLNNDATFMGNETQNSNSFSRLNSFGFVFPIPTYQGSLVFGVGLNKVRDFDNILQFEGYNENWAAFPDFFDQVAPENEVTDVVDNIHQVQSINEEGGINHYSFSASVEMQKDFFLGATVNFLRGKDDYNMQFEEHDRNNLHNTPPYTDDNGYTHIGDLDYWIYNQSIVSEFSATNIKLGALYRVGSMLRLGATVVPPTTIKIKENWSDEWVETYDDGSTFETPPEPSEYEYKIQEPYSFGFGASLKLLNFLFSADMEFQDWSQAKFKTDPPIAGMTKANTNFRIQEELQAVQKLHLGAEMYIPLVRAKVRAGYFTEPSPYKYAETTEDKKFYSAGASLMLDKQVMVDLAYVRGLWKQETSDALTNAPTLEDKNVQKLLGTVSIRF